MSGLSPVSVQLDRLRSDDLTTFVNDRAFSRARTIFTTGGVSSARAEGSQLFARVRDRVPRPYQVNVTLADTNLFAVCTCNQDGICEHAAAVLLAWTANRYLFSFAPPDEQMAPLAVPPADALWRAGLGDNRRMAALLASQRISDLRKLAQRVELEAEGETKETLAWRLGPRLLEKGRISSALAQATTVQQAALQALLLYDRGVSPADVERVVQLAGGQSSGIDTALKGLVALGLAFTTAPGTPASSGWQLPSELAVQLPPDPLPLATVSQHSVAGSERGLSFVSSLRALCMLIESQPPHARSAPARSQFEQQNAVLKGWHNLPEEVEQLKQRSLGIFVNEPIYMTMQAPPLPVDEPTLHGLAVALKRDEAAVALMLRLLDQLKLLAIRDRRLRLLPRSELLWEASAVEQARLLAVTWANEIMWSEFHDLPGVRLRRHLQASYSARLEQVYAELAGLRRAVVRFVRGLAPDQTWSVESLLDTMRRLGPALPFHYSVGSADRVWQLCDRHGSVLDPQRSSDWRLGIVPFVQQVLRQMHLLGLVVTDAEVSAVRLTGLGAYLLGMRGEYQPQPSGAVLQIGNDLTVAVPALDADATLLEQLDTIGEREGFSDGSFRYRLTARAFRSALLRGRQASESIAFLQRHTAEPLPPSLVEAITTWAASFGQVQLYGGVALLELADDLLLTELLRTTSLGSALVSQLTPRLLVIDPERSTALWNELVAKGYTPHRVRSVSGPQTP